MRIRTASAILLFISLSALAADDSTPERKGPYQDQCATILGFQNLTLKDLVDSGLLIKKSDFVYATEGDLQAHELQTTTLLAERLQQTLALIPRAFNIDIPAVDGVIYDSNGIGVSNFSLKTVSTPDSANMNEVVKNAIRRAEEGVDDNYSRNRWRVISDARAPKRFGAGYRESIRLAFGRIFGLSRRSVRPVSIVIDYSAMPNASLHLIHEGLEGTKESRTYITLEDHPEGAVELNRIMNRVREKPNIKEYIFLGTHHLLRITASGYSLDEYCDDLGHVHCAHAGPFEAPPPTAPSIVPGHKPYLSPRE